MSNGSTIDYSSFMPPDLAALQPSAGRRRKAMDEQGPYQPGDVVVDKSGPTGVPGEVIPPPQPPRAWPTVDPSVSPTSPVAQPTYMGGAPPSVPPLTSDPTATTAGSAADIGASAATPSPLGPVLGRTSMAGVMNPTPEQQSAYAQATQPSRWALMKQPGNYEPTQSWGQTDADVQAGMPGAGQGMTKLGKLLSILHGAGLGALAGSTQPTFGTGALAAEQRGQQNQMFAQQLPQQQIATQLARQNLQYNPIMRLWELQKTQADIQQKMAEAGKFGAEGQKAIAETQGLPIEQALKKAQTEAAYYKEDPNLGLIDTRTKQPVTDAGMVPLDAAHAAILGKQPGERVPLKLLNQADEYLTRGWHVGTGNGRSFLVNDKDPTNKIDLGVATPMMTMQMQASGGGLGPYGMSGGAVGGGGGASPRPAPTNAPGGWVTGDGRTLNDVPSQIRGEVQQVLEYRRPDPSITQRGIVAQAINQWVSELDPQHDLTTYGNRNKILNAYTTDASTGELGAINTALGHLGDLYTASQALSKHNTPLLHSIASKWGAATGGTDETVYEGILHKVGPELSKAYLKSGGSVGERGENEKDFDLSRGQAQIQNNIYEAANLLNSKLESKRNDWEKNFLPYRDQDHFDARWVTAPARQTLQMLSSKSPVAGAGGGNAPPANPSNKPTFGVRVGQ